MASLKQKVLASMKSRDTEGWFELYATRTPGYLFALLFKALRMHPIAVTLLSIVLGCSCGYFFYFIGDLKMVLIGIGLFLLANWLDCADGQLARMTGQKTQVGRILDGFAGDACFFCIYHGIVIGLTPEWGIWIWLLGYVSGCYFHAHQAQLADYYRNAHLYYIGAGSELDRACDLKAQYDALNWKSSGWFQKLYLVFYKFYTKGQERSTPNFQRFHAAVKEKYGDDIPQTLRDEYRKYSKPLMPLCQLLTIDARVGIMFVTLLIGMPWIFLVFECTAFEALRFYVRGRHEKFCKKMLANL